MDVTPKGHPMSTDQYLTLAPTELPDATMYHLPQTRFVAAQQDDQTGRWEVVELGHDYTQVIERGLGRGEAETLAHGVRLVRLAEMGASA